MAKADVTLKFNAEDAEFVQRIFKQKEAYEAAGNSARDMGLKVAAAGDKIVGAGAKMKKSGEDVSESMFSAGTAVLALEKAVAGVARVVGEDFDRMKRKAEGAHQAIQTLQGSLATSGQIEALPQVKSALQDMQSATVTGKQKNEIFGRISAKGGANVSVNDKISATRAAVDYAQTGASNLGEFGETYQALKKYFPNATDDVLRSVSAEVMGAMPGGLDEGDERILAQSTDKEATLNRLLAGAGTSQTKKGMKRLQELVEHSPTDELVRKSQHQARKMTAAEKSELALAKLPPAERWDALMKNPDLAPEADRADIRAYALKYDARRVEKASEQNRFGQQVDQYSQTRVASDDVQRDYDYQRMLKRREEIDRKKEFDELSTETNLQNWRNKNANQFGTPTDGMMGTAGDVMGAAQATGNAFEWPSKLVHGFKSIVNAINENTRQTRHRPRPDGSAHPMENK